MSAYDHFLKKGSIAFDVGAYIGERTDMFLALGCTRVIAVEATNEHSSRLRKKYAADNRVIVLAKAAGPRNEKGVLRVHESFWPNGTRMDSALSTMSKEWLEGIDENADQWDKRFEHPDWIHRSSEWREEQQVEIVTIDSLISEYGEPDFIKIDVEGWECEVIKGLTHPVKALSFEFNTLLKLEWAEEVVDHLLRLSSYEFNYIAQDSLEFSLPNWFSKIELFADLQGRVIHGDIFARRLQ